MKARINNVSKISLDLVSSNLERANYYLKSKNLVVKFLSGSKYKYLKVPMTKVYSLISAKSKGKYFNRNIKNKFKFIKIS